MEYIGKIVSTHGIKGELRIINEFEYPEKVFFVGNKLIIDNKEYTIRTYRHHKIYDMVTLDNYNNINEVEFLIGKKVYVKKDKIKLNDSEITSSELLEYNAIIDGKKYEITEAFDAGSNNKIIRVKKEKDILVPLASPMVKKLDKKRKEVIIELIGGMEWKLI